MDVMFRPYFLLSQSQVTNILPDENQQAYNYDILFYQISRLRTPFDTASIWAIDDFAEKNGTTVVFPKSHTWDSHRRPTSEKMMKVEMPVGSVIFFLGTTWDYLGLLGTVTR